MKRLFFRVDGDSWLGGLTRHGGFAVAFAVLVSLLGCGRELSTEYGKSSGTEGLKSINGFGALRQSLELNGWKTRDIRQLSDRLQQLDAIVWIPTTATPPNRATLDWFAEWLRRQPRTLVYVLADPGSESEYWESIASLATPAQRLEFRRRAAARLAEEMTDKHWGTHGDDHYLDLTWFAARWRGEGTPVWEIVPQAPIISNPAASVPAGGVPAAGSSATAAEPAFNPFTGDSSESFFGDEPPTAPVDIDLLRMKPLAQASDGTPLAVRIDSQPAGPYEPTADGIFVRPPVGFAPSRVIVVAGGSLINNFAVGQHSQPQGRRLVRQLIQELGQNPNSDPPRVGFLVTGPQGVPIVQSGDEKPSTGSGSEWLTVWPLSLITLHLALIGIIACLIMLPIFGRPRRLREATSGDFADHIHAVAQLMKRTGGEAVARERISEYFRKVRGETTGPWVIAELPLGSPPTTPTTPEMLTTPTPEMLTPSALPTLPQALPPAVPELDPNREPELDPERGPEPAGDAQPEPQPKPQPDGGPAR